MNLQTRILLLLVGTTVLLTGAFTGVHAWIDYQSARDNLRSRVIGLAESIAPTIRTDLLHNRANEMRRIVHSFKLNQRILDIEVLSPENEILTNAEIGHADDFIYPPDSAGRAGKARYWSSDDRFATLVPVESQFGTLLGYVYLQASSREEFRSMRTNIAWGLIFGGLLGIGGSLAGFIVGRKIASPLQELARTADKVAEGEAPDLFNVQSRDEVGRLSRSFRKMIEKRREAEESLQQSNQHLLFILRETPLAYIEWDLNFRVLSWNKSAEKIFGYPESKALGKHALDLVVPDFVKDEIETVWNRILDGSGGNRNLNQNRCADGSLITCQWNNTVIHGPSGKPIAVASLVNDVTESITTQETMRMAMEEAQKATAAKSEFLANMSHEIRTPMNGVIGLTELLLETDLDESQRSNLEVIRGSGEMLLTIINDILDLSRIESGNLRLSEKPFDIRKSLQASFELFAPTLENKGLEAAVEIHDSVPAQVHGDPNRIRQIVYNLISNAVKFTDKGAIRLRARAEPVTSLRLKLFVTIEDTGSGISPDRAESIFEPFSQADTSPTRTHGGTGLGLTICKHLCTMMRGDIRLDHSSPEGSAFTFHVELQSPPDPAPSPSAPGDAAKPEAQPGEAALDLSLKILIAEDNAVNRLVAKRLLKRLGYACATVDNGRQALDFVGTNPCDVVFMDLQMPVMDGFTATRLIREHYPDSAPAIVALTASAVEGDRDRCLAAGMDDYIAKPINIQAIRRVMSRFSSPEWTASRG